ncbi:MAG: nitrilase-related carbon-nitrogen hydrolase, partial [Nitrososphaerales archaeon]
MEPYSACVIQPRMKSDKKEQVTRCLELIDNAVPFVSVVSAPCKLLLFPECFLQPAKGGMIKNPTHQERIKRMKERAIYFPGEETDMIGERARANKCYVSGQIEGIIPEFPDRFFSIAFIIGPNGKPIHRYFKTTTTNAFEVPMSPQDIYDDYVKVFGDKLESFFPVANTDIGRLGTLICGDGMYPEYARGLGLQGMEVLLRPTSSPDPTTEEPNDVWTVQNRARALENCCYVMFSNQGGGGYMGMDVCAGNSIIVDYLGRIMAHVTKGGETLIHTTISIDTLRAFRRHSGGWGGIHNLRTDAIKKIYENEFWPKNVWKDKQPLTLKEIAERRDPITQG